MASRSMDALATQMPEFSAMIAERAYFKAEQRGFAPGYELEDWLAAEREVAALDSQPKMSAKPKIAAKPKISAKPKKVTALDPKPKKPRKGAAAKD